MKRHFNKLLLILLLVMGVKESAFAQTPPNVVLPATACPNQIITANVSWNNVSVPSYSLYTQGTYPAGPPILVFSSPSFTVSGPATVNYVLQGTGVYQGSSITMTTGFALTVQAPPPMTLNYAPDYCNGDCAVINAQSGGNSYSWVGSNTAGTTLNGSNVVNICNLQQNNTGPVTITSVIGGCTLTGVANIAVAPLKNLAINTASNVCEGKLGITLTSNLPGGTGYQWYHNNAPMLGATSQNTIIAPTGATILDGGSYRIDVFDLFNTGANPIVQCPYSATTQVTVVETSPVLLTASPGTAVCQGAILNLNASTSPTANTLSWIGPSFISSIPNPAITPALPSHGGNYSVTATFQGAFITCTTGAVINVSVVPVSPPVIIMPTSICQGDNLIINHTAGPNVFGPISWSGPAFASQPGQVNNPSPGIPHIQTNASGTQFLTVNYGLLPGGISSLQCPSTASAQLNVVPVTTVLVIPPQPVCTPDNAFLQALATGAYMYTWTGPNGFSSTSPQGNAYVYYPTVNASGIYSVTAFFGNGNLVCQSDTTVQLQVYPVMPFSLVPIQQTCYNTPITVTGPSGATSYTWTSSTGFTSNTKDLNFPNIQPTNAGTYTLNISLGPCISTAETEIIVLDPITFTLTPFDRTICAGDTIVLEAGAAGGSGNYSYSWNPGIYLETNNGPRQVAVPLGSVAYNLMVHDIACPSFKRSHAVTITAKQPPLPRLELSPTEGCAPLCLFYDTKSQSETAIATYDFGGNRVFQRDSMPFNYCLDEEGSYTLKIYSKGKNGCSGTYEFPYPIIVNPKSGSDVTWSPEIPTTTDEIIFHPTSTYEPVTNYSWSFLGGVTPGDTSHFANPGGADTTNIKNPKRIYEKFGTYPVVLITQNDRGCIDTVMKFMKVIDEMQMFVPNVFTPNDDGLNDEFKVKGTGMKVENFSMDIFNRAGLIVFTTKDINEGWDGKVGGKFTKDATYVYLIKVVGMNGEGRKEITGTVTVIK